MKKSSSAGRKCSTRWRMRASLEEHAGSESWAAWRAALPDVIETVQPAADLLWRDGEATPGQQFGGQGGTTPPCATPAESARRTFQDREQRALQRREVASDRARLPHLISGRGTLGDLAAAVGFDRPIDARPRAEEEGGNLGRGAPLRTEQQDVEREQIAKACLTRVRTTFVLGVPRESRLLSFLAQAVHL